MNPNIYVPATGGAVGGAVGGVVGGGVGIKYGDRELGNLVGGGAGGLTGAAGSAAMYTYARSGMRSPIGRRAMMPVVAVGAFTGGQGGYNSADVVYTGLQNVQIPSYPNIQNTYATQVIHGHPDYYQYQY